MSESTDQQPQNQPKRTIVPETEGAQDDPVVSETGAEQLQNIVERLEALESERRSIGEDMKEIRKEAKDAGFDTKLINQLLKERREDPRTVAEREEKLDLYRRATGNTPSVH